MKIQPIRTKYAGVLFRSRQEARWAVLFDGIGLDWQYEAEGYQLPSQWYVPDFWLPQIKCFAEVKGAAEQWDKISNKKACELCETTLHPVMCCIEITSGRQLIWTMFHDREWLHCVDLVDSLKNGRPTIRFDPNHIAAEDFEIWNASAERALGIRFTRNLRRQKAF
jgi:hypothetical protein